MIQTTAFSFFFEIKTTAFSNTRRSVHLRTHFIVVSSSRCEFHGCSPGDDPPEADTGGRYVVRERAPADQQVPFVFNFFVFFQYQFLCKVDAVKQKKEGKAAFPVLSESLLEKRSAVILAVIHHHGCSVQNSVSP